MFEDIEGVGPELEKRLRQEFGSYSEIRQASWVDLMNVHGIGPIKARRINPPKGLI